MARGRMNIRTVRRRRVRESIISSSVWGAFLKNAKIKKKKDS